MIQTPTSPTPWITQLTVTDICLSAKQLSGNTRGGLPRAQRQRSDLYIGPRGDDKIYMEPLHDGRVI